jgi:hypothetical protein
MIWLVQTQKEVVRMPAQDRRTAPALEDEWDETEAQKVEPTREFFGEFVNLDKGDELTGWLIGKRKIRDKDRYYLQATDGRILILPDHALLTAALNAIPHYPTAVKIRNTGRKKLASGRIGFSYEVYAFPRNKAPVEVLEAVARLNGEL